METVDNPKSRTEPPQPLRCRRCETPPNALACGSHSTRTHVAASWQHPSVAEATHRSPNPRPNRPITRALAVILAAAFLTVSGPDDDLRNRFRRYCQVHVSTNASIAFLKLLLGSGWALGGFELFEVEFAFPAIGQANKQADVRASRFEIRPQRRQEQVGSSFGVGHSFLPHSQPVG